MNKIFRLFFKKYEVDDYLSYLHSGVGYNGVAHISYISGRQKHRGVGYGGIYE